MSERKLDIFNVLGHIDRRNMNLWSTLDDDQRKEFAPLVVMRWMSGTSDAQQLVILNECVNTRVFQLGHHKELLMKLLAASSNGRQKRYQWLHMKNKAKKMPMFTKLLQEISPYADIEEMIKLNADTADKDIIAEAEAHGWQSSEIAYLKKELKNRE